MADISVRLRDALVADLVDEAVALKWDEEVERLTHDRIKEDYEVAAHLGRLLGFHTIAGPGDIKATLMSLVPELQRMLRDWPLPEDGKSVDILARQACRDLSPNEVYATLLAGPARWRRDALRCTVDGLSEQLAPILLRGFTSSLNEMLRRWAALDVPKLYLKWQNDKKTRDEKARKAERAARAALTPEERRRKREDDAKIRSGYFTPPGRTT
jgi:hypothetical protein